MAALSTQKVLQLLERYESQNVTYIDPTGGWPIVWERAKGNFVWDANGRRYLDLTAAFGVAAAGHGNSNVIKAGQEQMAKLVHAMGDVHPHGVKAQLARELSRLTFERWHDLATERTRHKCNWGKTIFCNSGFEAVEAALKTAWLATRRRDIIAFEGAYHGLGYGALNATHREHFRGGFLPQLANFGHFAPFPKTNQELDRTRSILRGLFRNNKIGAILVEPVQVRGGVNVPPKKFLSLLRQLCDEAGAVLIFDEIYTGFARTGRWFACEYTDALPDMICLGKGLTGGFPLSASVGRADLMDRAWPKSSGEAIHTSTFLGHPVGCAMALANIRELQKRGLVTRAAALGLELSRELGEIECPPGLELKVRGIGLLAGLEVRLTDGRPATAAALFVVKEMLREGFVLLPEGEMANVISLTPPLTITAKQLHRTVTVLKSVFKLSQFQTQPAH